MFYEGTSACPRGARRIVLRSSLCTDAGLRHDINKTSARYA